MHACCLSPWPITPNPGSSVASKEPMLRRAALQGSHDWTGLYKSQADQPIPDPDLRLELVKTGYLIQAAYKYLTDFREYAAAYDGLPMVCPPLPFAQDHAPDLPGVTHTSQGHAQLSLQAPELLSSWECLNIV